MVRCVFNFDPDYFSKISGDESKPAMSKNAGYTPLHGNPNGGKDKPSNGYGSKLGTDNWMFNAKNRQV